MTEYTVDVVVELTQSNSLPIVVGYKIPIKAVNAEHAALLAGMRLQHVSPEYTVGIIALTVTAHE
jgi:hypothetical protein